MDDSFRRWLAACGLSTRTIQTRTSNCRTVERHEGDLDRRFENDGLSELLARLRYTKQDERHSRRARHHIPIAGSVYNGTATLKSAVTLYKRFRENRGHEGPTLKRTGKQANSRIAVLARPPPTKQLWPTWSTPDSKDVLEFARLSIQYVHFLNPEVVRAITEDNERQRDTWIRALQKRRIDPDIYLWAKSPCAFPGVRRYAGSREIAAHRGHTSLGEIPHALKLDDNDYPKQIWSFVFRGRKFSKHGPKNYALAHLGDHKDHNNRLEQDFAVAEEYQGTRVLHGLFTCPSNTVYVANTVLRPTDFDKTIRNLLIRRADELYGSFCNMLPPFLRIPVQSGPEWSLDKFRWTDPVGTMDHIKQFLEFRKSRIAELFFIR